MTFEEFFKKKRINLVALQNAEPGLLSEFKVHFEQMGEKSFDHTKKYWFNKLRLLYHLAPELKPEKVHIENPLAQQTITESLLEEKIPAPSVGFKPRFKPGMISGQPKAESQKPGEEAESEKLKAESPGESVSKPAGFKPRFNMKMAAPKVEDSESVGEKQNAATENTAMQPDVPATEAAPKPGGFKPRFNARMMKPKPPDDEI